jgi:hypothetical protein
MTVIKNTLFTTLDFVVNPLVQRAIKKRHLRQRIAQDVLVTVEWSEFVLNLPRRPRNRLQEISLEIEGCSYHTEKDELVLSDGTVIQLEKEIYVEILDDRGDKYRLESGNYGISSRDAASETWAIDTVGFSMPPNDTYIGLRIRSDKPFGCKRIVWHNYNLK